MRFRSALLLGFLLLSAAWTPSNGQQLRDAFRKVRQAVVIIRTKQIDLAPSPGQIVSVVDGLGSGVLISNDGKVLTAAHVVQTADKTEVEFPDGELIPARVIGSVVNADVALLQLDRAPMSSAPAPLVRPLAARVLEHQVTRFRVHHRPRFVLRVDDGAAGH